MIKCYDEFDNIVTESKHNAEMISAYLTNLSTDLKDVITPDAYNMLIRCSEFVWFISKDLPEE